MLRKPTPADIWKAIQIYLDLAYRGSLPSAVRSRLETLRPLAEDEFYSSPLLERNVNDDSPRYSIRLGNRFYPHMKLAIDPRPDRQGYLFRVDTHDRHCCPPPQSPEHDAFCQLMRDNQDLAQTIERAWEEQGIVTFKTYLREDLTRRATS